MMSAVYFLLLVVFVNHHDVMADRLGQLCLDAEAVGTSETLRQICQEYYQNSDGGPSYEYGSKLHPLRSPPYAADVDSSVYDGDKSNEQLLRRTLLALLPSRSAYLRQILAAGDRSGSIDDDNKSDKRDGNYIRFGKKQHSQFKRTAPIVRSYLASFGARDKKPGGQYMRFGRSVAPLNANDSASRAAGYTKNSSKHAAKSPDRKRFMRFGRSSAEQEKEKRFMRFGRAHGKIDESGVEDDDQSHGSEPPVDALFFRFGRNFMRFGRAHANPDTDSKRQEAPVAIGARQQKRFMRFGRAPAQKRFMRFGKSMPNAVAVNLAADGAEYDADKQIQPEKRFMRFGKRTDDGAIGDNSLNAAHKRFMRFGKRTLVIGAGTPKRFMRFGRSTDRPAAKRLLKRTSGGKAD